MRVISASKRKIIVEMGSDSFLSLTGLKKNDFYYDEDLLNLEGKTFNLYKILRQIDVLKALIECKDKLKSNLESQIARIDAAHFPIKEDAE